MLEFDVSSLLCCFFQGTLVLPPSSKTEIPFRYVLWYIKSFLRIYAISKTTFYFLIYLFISFIRSFVHSFTHYVNIFWNELNTILKSQDLVSTNFDFKDILFGHFCPDNDDSILVNYIILESKYLIFRSKFHCE